MQQAIADWDVPLSREDLSNPLQLMMIDLFVAAFRWRGGSIHWRDTSPCLATAREQTSQVRRQCVGHCGYSLKRWPFAPLDGMTSACLRHLLTQPLEMQSHVPLLPVGFEALGIRTWTSKVRQVNARPHCPKPQIEAKLGSLKPRGCSSTASISCLVGAPSHVST